MNRRLLLSSFLATLLAACATGDPSTQPAPSPNADVSRPIVFVHGNGDTAGLWVTQIWRFESNGYDRRKLYAVDFRNPLARTDDSKAQEHRSSTEEQRAQLAKAIDDVLQSTGAKQVALVGNSRGANTIRNYVKSGGAAKVSHVVLGGGVNHGVWASDFMVTSEFNGLSTFMKGLNAPQANGDEVAPGVRWMTIRSDNNDKFAQPDGRFIGRPRDKTNISFDAPALKGAENIVLAKADHREVAYGAEAFRHMFRFITGVSPSSPQPVAEKLASLNGNLTGFANGAQTNVPIAGGKVTVFEVSATTGARLGAAVHSKTVDAGGAWGPFSAKPFAHYEFMIEAAGYPTTHLYRANLMRSTQFMHLRPMSPVAFDGDDKAAGSVVNFTRPRGYFGHGRDTFTIDGKVPGGINEGVPGASTGKLRLADKALRPVPVQFNQEKMVVQTWPASENRVVVAEFND
jgi:triacylglycerol lipase